MPKKKQEWAAECRYARKLAACADGACSAMLIAEAMAACPVHEIMAYDGMVQMTYLNEFGPTCGVDDTLEQMTTINWADAFTETMRRLLADGGVKPVGTWSRAIFPTVTITPEGDTPIINKVTLLAKVPPKLYGALLPVLNKREVPK